MNNPAFSAFSSLALKVVGVILIVSSLLDYIVLAIPFQITNKDWQLTLASNIVDRGIIPMVGIAFLIAGYWIGESLGNGDRGVSVTDLRFWSFIFACFLGLMFLLFIPLHLGNLRYKMRQATEQIEQGLTAAEQQIQTQFDQINQLLADDARIQQLDRAIASGQVTGARLEQLQTIRNQIDTLKDNPAALEEQLEQANTQLQQRRKEAEERAKTNAFKSGVRTGVSSLLLAIGYSVIGAMGFRGLAGGGGVPSRRRI
ncbi:MAG: HpsJ family protein [Cyanobacteria bacterium SBLK]|nr:HpsJ family protein [Cyanobacteria bacterium SBLK]